jgi:hypothetical protein
MAKSHYLYISSKNRNENEKKYNFRVRLNNAIICKRDEGLNVSVCGFSMLNSDYNCKNFSFTISKYSLVGIYENSYICSRTPTNESAVYRSHVSVCIT